MAPTELDQAIDRLLAHAGSESKKPACTPSQLDARERTLARPIPDELRRLLLRVSPAAWGAAFGGGDDPRPLELMALDELAWTDNGGASGQTDEEEEDEDDEDRPPLPPMLAFASFIYGDQVMLAPGVNGSAQVVLDDHESDERFAVLAPTLAAWINRLLDDGTDYFYFPGELESAPVARRRELLELHRRLNPHIEWSARALHRLDHPNGDPAGYLAWDGSEHRLRPIAEVPHAYSAALDDATETDVRSLAGAPWLLSVIITRGWAGDLSVLATLPSLEYVGLYDAQDADAAPLAASRSLTKLCVQGGGIRGLPALAAVPTLEQVEVRLARFDPAELDALAAARPGLYIDVLEEARRKTSKKQRSN